jgi:endonuclease YncB( thermonuclease family)
MCGIIRYFCFIVFFTCLYTSAIAGQPTSFIGKVTAITDGDTIKVLCNKQEIKIRLYGIDAPEKKQDYGNRAKQACSALCFGKDVTVSVTGKDRYRRTIAIAYLADSTNINQELVKRGAAWWYREYAPDSKELPQLEANARKDKVGLWALPDPVAPWEWRKNKSKKKLK